MVAQLPVELYDEVLQYIAGDRENLLNCSLTSRALLTPSQKQLFSRVIIRSPSKPPTDGFGPHRLFALGGSAREFRSLVEASPHIATYVQSFQILDMERCAFKSIWTDNPEWLSKDHNIPFILPRLCQLRSLVVDYANGPASRWDKVSETFLSSLVDIMRLPTLVHIFLNGAPLNLLTRGLSSNLKHCAVSGIHSMGQIHLPDKRLDTYIDKRTTQALTNLYSLYIQTIHIPRLLSDSSTSLNLSRLRKLVVGMGWKMEGHRDTQNLLKLCARSLEEFVFSPCYNAGFPHQDLSTSIDSIDIAQLTALRQFRVHLELNQGRNSLPWFTHFLRGSSGINTHLEEFTILVLYQFRRVGADFHFISDGLNALQNEKFPALRDLNLVFVVPDEDEREVVPFAIDTFEGFWDLRHSISLDFNVSVCRSMHDKEALYTFSPDPRWEPVLDTAEFWETEVVEPSSHALSN